MDRGTMGGGTLLPRGSHRVLTCDPTGIISSVSALTLQPARCSSFIILESPSSPAVTRGDRTKVCVGNAADIQRGYPSFFLVCMARLSVETVVLCV